MIGLWLEWKSAQRDLQRAYRVASGVETGMIHINDQGVNDEPHVPFGGVKASGIGRYYSNTVMDKFTELKWITFKCNRDNISSDDYIRSIF
jgi:acyl-CoA reductase-like NAD-dependent aldehyde dehydrogenase